MFEILLATQNPKKVREFRDLFDGLPVALRLASSLPAPLEVVEDGTTFEANARKKAAAFAEASGGWALADDSGLEVDALEGRPGVRSSRFAGPDTDDRKNNERLLAMLRGIPTERRGARFRCFLCLRDPGGREIAAEGSAEGRIVEEPRGEEGFGYDPLFLVPSE
jgi:XTP/dITP diphosphohydrolase